MDGIEGSNWLTGKGLPGAIDHFVGDPQDVPMRSCSRKLRAAVCSLRLRQFAQMDRSDQYSIALNESQIGCNDNLCIGQQLTNNRGGLFIQEPRENGARLRIQVHRGPRSSSSNCAALRRPRRERGIALYSKSSPGLPSVASPRFANASRADGTPESTAPCLGGENSATTSPRSVTRTLSPRRTSRRYSLSRFLSSLTPTVFINYNVAS